MMSVKVAMTDATELLGTLPLNQTSLLSGRAALLPGRPPQQSELRLGEDLLARRSRLLLQLWTSLKRAVTDMLQKQGCGIFRRWHGSQVSYWYFISAKELNFTDCKQK